MPYSCNPYGESLLQLHTLTRVRAGYDGVNLDIEDFDGFEGAGGGGRRLPPLHPPAKPDAASAALTALVCELRAAMTAALPGSQLSFASAATPATNGRHYDYRGISECFLPGDFYFVMAYAMQATKHTNVPAPDSPLPAVQLGLVNYQRLGVRPSQLVLGLPFYGYDTPCTAPAPAACTIEPGSWSTSRFQIGYGSIVDELIPLAGGAKAVRWNASAASPYFDYMHPPAAAAAAAAGGAVRHRVYFDNPRSIRAKVAVAEAAGVGGIGVWTGTALPYATDPAAAKEMWAALKADDPANTGRASAPPPTAGQPSSALLTTPFVDLTPAPGLASGYKYAFMVPVLLPTPGGALLAFAEAHMLIYTSTDGSGAEHRHRRSRQRLGDGDDGWIDAVARRSSSNGSTWGALLVLCRNSTGGKEHGPGVHACEQPAPVADMATGKIHLLLAVDNWRHRMVSSSDDGRSFTPFAQARDLDASLRRK